MSSRAVIFTGNPNRRSAFFLHTQVATGLSTAGRVFALPAASSDSIPGILYCAPALPGMISEDRTMSPEPLTAAPKQTKIDLG